MSLDRTQAPSFSLSTDYSLTQPELFAFPSGQPLYAFRGLQQGVVKLELVFRSGKWYEPASGVSHFTAQMLRKGTRTRSAFEIAEALDRLGAHLEIVAGFDTVTVSLFVLKKNLFPALDILLDLLHEPSFPEEEIRLEKEIFIQNLRVSNEKTSVLASREIRKTLFGVTHPYGNSTIEADVDIIKSDDLRDFFRKHMRLHAAYFVGAVETEELNQLIKRFNAPTASSTSLSQPAIQTGVSHAVVKPGSVQVSLRLGKLCMMRAADAGYFDCVMVNHLLGGYFGSRLMKNIREKKGLTYGIGSGMHHFVNNSFWYVRAEVNQQHAQQALDEIRNEIRNLQEEPVSQNELDVATNYFIGSWQSDNATLFAVAEKVRSLHEHDLPDDYYNRLLGHLRNMTPVDVQRAAKKYFGADDLVEIRVG